MKSKLFVLFAVIMFSCQLGFAQAWSGILDPSRATDWTQAGIPGGIPNRTTVCATVPPSGLTDATDMNNIENAITSCPANQVVMLTAGTYTITAGLTFGTASNVTLRGAGPDRTILKFTGINGCSGNWADICVMGNNSYADNYPHSTGWTAGYSQGASTITVSSATGLSTTPGASGNIVILDQRDDEIGVCPVSGGTGACAGVSGAVESGTTVTITTSIPHGYSVGQCVGVGTVANDGYNSDSNHSLSCGGTAGLFSITAVPSSTTFQYAASSSGLSASGGGYVVIDTGGVIAAGVTNVTTSAGVGYAGRQCPDTHGAECVTGEISARNQMEFKQITGISGNQVTLTPPLVMPNWRTSQNPGVWWTGNYATEDGVENLTYDMTNDSGNSSSGGIEFYNSYHCWAKNVRGINANRNHIWILQSYGDEVVDSYFFGSKGGYTTSYGVETFDGDSGTLVQNNICQHVVNCVLVGSDFDAVYSYNYALDDGYVVPDWMMSQTNGSHDWAGYNLFEGNDGTYAASDDDHGTGNVQTFFRNRFRGQNTPLKANSLLAGNISAFNRGMNFVGNVMGSLGSQTGYQTTVQGTFNEYVWALDVPDSGTVVPNDPLTHESLLRWGNYDVVSNAVRWCGNSSDPGWSTICNSTTEIPGAFAFLNANAVPASTTLPSSFYLSAEPSFWQTAWGTPPWPAIGPDVTGGTAPDGVGGHSNSIPAQLCYANTPIDSTYQQTFTVTGASWSGGTATLAIGTNALTAQNTVTISGVSPAGFNGIFEITSETSTTISYALPNDPGTYTSGGAVTYPNILLFNAASCYPAAYGGQPAPPTNLTAVPH